MYISKTGEQKNQWCWVISPIILESLLGIPFVLSINYSLSQREEDFLQEAISPALRTRLCHFFHFGLSMKPQEEKLHKQ